MTQTNNPLQFTFRAEATFNRPADTTAYASGDLIANSTTASLVQPMRFFVYGAPGVSDTRATHVLVTQARIIIGAGAPTDNLRLNLYHSEPFAAGAYPADNAAYRGASGAITSTALTREMIVGDVSTWTQAAAALSYADIVLATPIMLDTSSLGYVSGLLEARGTFTPGNGVAYTVVLHGMA